MAPSAAPPAGGRVVVMTGASSGIGLNWARKALARCGIARLVIAARSSARCAEALALIALPPGGVTTAAQLPAPAASVEPILVNGARVEALPCDLGSLASVAEFAASVQSLLGASSPVHLLVLNAGLVSGSAFDKTARSSADGYEMTFSTNHLAHFALARALEPQLRVAGAAGGARIVLTSSEGHRMAKLPRGGRDEAAWREVATVLGRGSCFSAYADSKLANALHAVELQRRLAGAGVSANALHPGAIRETGIWEPQRGLASFLIDGVMFPLGRLFGAFQSVDEGGDAIAACADPAAAGGQYRDVARWVAPAKVASDPAVAAALWAASGALVDEALAKAAAQSRATAGTTRETF
jgi:NAD(P)-dependent dehydrogenase (short-subunit alcohol dehydrogenase family)